MNRNLVIRWFSKELEIDLESVSIVALNAFSEIRQISDTLHWNYSKYIGGNDHSIPLGSVNEFLSSEGLVDVDSCLDTEHFFCHHKLLRILNAELLVRLVEHFIDLRSEPQRQH